MSAITDELRSIAESIASEGHALGDRLVQIWHTLFGDAQQLETEAVADGEQVLADAEAAAAPVEAEIKTDATQLLDEAEADVQAAVQPPASA